MPQLGYSQKGCIMANMIRWKLNSLIGELEDTTKSKYSLARVAKEAEISYPAVHRISQNTADRIDTKTLDKLMMFFSGRLDRRVTVDDLLQYEEPAGQR